MTLDETARLTTIIVMIGVALGDVEVLASPAQLQRAGFYSWDVMKTIRGWTAEGALAGAAERILDAPLILWLLGAQLISAGVAISGVGPATPWIAVAFGVNLVIHLRNRYGLDGSDQMQTIVLAALLLYNVSPSHTGRVAAICFIAAQSILSYLTSGWAKAISPVWRSGQAVGSILNTGSYGGPAIAGVMHAHPILSRVASHATLVFECAMPLLVFLSPTACIAFIAAGVTFHAGIAAAMGLNLFFWSFVSTYPALLFLSHAIGVF